MCPLFPPKWSAGRDMLTGAGSMKAGARFNAAGSSRMVYGSSTPELAMIESLAFQWRAVLPVQHALPLVFKAASWGVSPCRLPRSNISYWMASGMG